MINYVTEDDINEEKVIYELGDNSYGDEDFAFFKCPNCKKIYLMDYEIEILYYDSSDLEQITACNRLICLDCGYDFENKVIIGEKAECIFKVTKNEILDSGWARFLNT